MLGHKVTHGKFQVKQITLQIGSKIIFLENTLQTYDIKIYLTNCVYILKLSYVVP